MVFSQAKGINWVAVSTFHHLVDSRALDGLFFITRTTCMQHRQRCGTDGKIKT
jgi:hypothetical protein